MASKNKKFNIKHLGGNIDSSESAQVTKDYEVRSFISFIQEREREQVVRVKSETFLFPYICFLITLVLCLLSKHFEYLLSMTNETLTRK